MKVNAVVTLLISTITLVFGCVPPNCGNIVDCGSCGNACCKLQFYFKGATEEEVAQDLYDVLKVGGPDQLYQMQETFTGELGLADYRERDGLANFVGQTTHRNEDGNGYVDLINFSINPWYGTGTMVNMFSLTTVGGLYCDEGSNFMNIKNLMDAMTLPSVMTHIDESCFEMPGAAQYHGLTLDG
uniref:Uncharacterized protein n=1 Tax=Fibrocapsa japonica TaxID=94617 RepID=A0A7S2XXM6_9STRA|mmetsp:Transcript_20450/g.29595  ORF Transcript_20450/g.29595 Transcript_20450/m.29595 type:complete len:185 (+) Transcript_20450:88-642(+)|eukprot:CAMPEP_0113952694 /NCGR_PEP_ID=MMETSP1339-20121228/90564_1 /TAXON_ID=94617 /ORGANISM="Fibrocapsa japonica" /LENGTH=184 /DNA_ID=CAMNT_0000961349 /DNA_START=88 /DNA_END=642 /DNA_ORIENTATION=+ /assembly_acc=CAM_ASM_000762